MTPAQTLLQRINEKRAEQARLLAQLDLWASVQAQGIEVASVEAFGFDEGRLTQRQRFESQREQVCTGRHAFRGELLANGHYRPNWLNYVRLKNGNTRTLDPMLRSA